MEEKKQVEQLTDDQAEKAAGGENGYSTWMIENCTHPSLTKYNEFREKSYFIFASIKQQRCRCDVCFEEIWIDV